MKILITGAAKRIGRLIALQLADEGHQIIIHYNRSKNEAASVLKQLNGEGHSTITRDLSRLEETESLFPELYKKGILPDILINNASTFYRRGLENFTSQEMKEDYV